MQSLSKCRPETPPSPEAKSTETPRAPSPAYAVHRELHLVCQADASHNTRDMDARSEFLGYEVLIVAVARREYLRRGWEAEQVQCRIDELVRELLICWIGDVAHGNEGDVNTGSEADRILDIKILYRLPSTPRFHDNSTVM